MSFIRITEAFAVSGQPELHAIETFAVHGFTSMINNRPDFEDPAQASHAAEAAACERAGLRYTHIPVSMASISEGDVRAFQAVLASANGPVLAHCKSGTRALTLFALGEVLEGRMQERHVAAFGARHGFDLSSASAWLAARPSSAKPDVKGFFDPRTWSVQYVVSDPETKMCAIIDPVLDFDEKSGSTSTASADAILDYIAGQDLTVEWILDTHPHADHFSAANYLKNKTGAPTAIGAHVTDVQRLWRELYNWPDLRADGSQWDRLFHDGDRFKIGGLEGSVIFSPGHTMASVTYVIGDAAFVHDTLFMPDSGTARADFPGGSAKALWDSIQRILALPDDTRLFTGHDYQPDEREPKWESTVAEQKLSNPHIAHIDEAQFIKLRQARDKTLPMPKLILHALQVNVRGGRLPEPELNGRRYLKLPLDTLTGAAW